MGGLCIIQKSVLNQAFTYFKWRVAQARMSISVQSGPVDKGCVRCSPMGTAPYTSCLCKRTCDVPAVLPQKVLISRAHPPVLSDPIPAHCLHRVLYVPLCRPRLTSSSLSPKSAGLGARSGVCAGDITAH